MSPSGAQPTQIGVTAKPVRPNGRRGKEAVSDVIGFDSLSVGVKGRQPGQKIGYVFIVKRQTIEYQISQMLSGLRLVVMG
jgi:hypothetical protein